MSDGVLESPIQHVMSRFELLDEDGGSLAVDQLPGRRDGASGR
jgi:hypothetical protein